MLCEIDLTTGVKWLLLSWHFNRYSSSSIIICLYPLSFVIILVFLSECCKPWLQSSFDWNFSLSSESYGCAFAYRDLQHIEKEILKSCSSAFVVGQVCVINLRKTFYFLRSHKCFARSRKAFLLPVLIRVLAITATELCPRLFNPMLKYYSTAPLVKSDKRNCL